jgi:hypothetical protein
MNNEHPNVPRGIEPYFHSEPFGELLASCLSSVCFFLLTFCRGYSMEAAVTTITSRPTRGN